MTTESEQIPGLGVIDGLDSTHRQFHEAALGVLAEHRTEGRPFVLFLRTFGVGFFDAESANQRLLENRLRDSLWSRGGLRIVTVQMREPSVNYESTMLVRDPRRRWLPALIVDDQLWLEAVKYIIERAELIVSEVVARSPGVLAELDACARARRQDRTVVVLPPAESILSDDQDTLDARFPRTIHSDELDSNDPLSTFVFRDLVRRLQRIDRVTVTTRVELIQRRALDARFPVSYAGLERGYAKLAARHRRSEAWTSAALAHAKAGQIAGLTGRQATPHLYESAEAWFSAQEPDRAMIGVRKVMSLFDASVVRRRGARRFSIDASESTWAKAVALRARILVTRGGRRAGCALLRASIQRARRTRQRRAEAALLITLAEFANASGKPRRKALLEAKNACLKAIRLSRAVREPVTEVAAFNRLGMIFWHDKDGVAASKALDQALKRLPRLGSINRHIQWSVLMNVGTVKMELGRPRAAQSAFQSAVKVARKSGDRAQLELAEHALQALGVRISTPSEATDASASRRAPAIVLFSPSGESAQAVRDTKDVVPSFGGGTDLTAQ